MTNLDNAGVVDHSDETGSGLAVSAAGETRMGVAQLVSPAQAQALVEELGLAEAFKPVDDALDETALKQWERLAH